MSFVTCRFSFAALFIDKVVYYCAVGLLDSLFFFFLVLPIYVSLNLDMYVLIHAHALEN